MWNSKVYVKILNTIVDQGTFRGNLVKNKEALYQLLADELHMSYHAVKGWTREKSNGPGDADVLKHLKKLLGTDLSNATQITYKEGENMVAIFSDFVKENIQKGYNLMIDYITSEDVEDEEAYCKMREALSKLQVAIPKAIFEKMEKCADDFLEPIIYDHENFFADLYTEEFGYFDNDHVFHMKNEEAIIKHAGIFYEKIWNVQKQIEKFGMEELYPLLVS